MADYKDKLATTLIQREEKLRAARSTWEALWQATTRYVLPNEATFQEKTTTGVERTRYILDSTAPRAVELFASFLHTTLNNPSARWIRLGANGRPELADDPEARKWFTEVEDLILAALGGEQSDLYSQFHSLYLMLGVVGTGIVFLDTSRSGALRVRQYHLDDCVIAEGESEMVDTVLRRTKRSVRWARQKWKGREDLGKSIDQGVGKKPKEPDAEVEFLHACMPSDDECMELLPRNVRTRLETFAYVSFWINKTDRTLVEAKGYEEFPYLVPRWYKARGEVYGRSPAMTALPDIRMVNQMTGTILRGAEKIVDPPLVIPDGALVSPVRMFPGGITYSEGAIEPKTLIPPGTSRIETGNALLEIRQQAIREAFFTPLFITPQNPVKTATQVLQEVDERNRALSPMLVRIQSELFFGLVRRTYNLLLRAGRVPDPPPVLRGFDDLSVEYVSPLVAAQRQMEGLSVMRLFELTAPWAQVDPGIFDHVDPDLLFPVLHAASAAPAKIARTRTKMEEVRKARSELAQQQQQAEQLATGGEVAAKLLAATKGQNAG